MIRVNLIPEDRRKKVREVKLKRPTLKIPKFDMILAFIILGAVVAGCVIVYLGQQKVLRDLDGDIADAREELRDLEKERKMVEDLEKRQRELKEWIALVQDLNKGRALHFHVMDEINKARPEYMWIVLFEEKNQRFKLNGRTFSNYMISNFMDELNSSSYFNDVKLDEIKTTQEKEHSVIGFQLSGNITLGGGN